MKPVIVIADDLTGAADTGACFTRAGFDVAIAFSPESQIKSNVMVFTTESRYAGEAEACKRIQRLVPAAQNAAYVYKKIDSTLRGYPGAELAELIDGLGVDKALVAPAFPAQGRTTVSGQQLIQGLPIEQTSFRNEVAHWDLRRFFRMGHKPIQPIPLDLLRSRPGETIKLLALPGPAIFIGDAETDADLQILARQAIQAGIRLLCGSAGLAAALVDCLPAKRLSNDRPPFPRRAGPILAIVGSRNPVTLEQVITAGDFGVSVVDAGQEIDSGLIQAVTACLDQGQDVILTTTRSKVSPDGPAVVAERLAQWSAYFVKRHTLGGLVLTGGDIAIAVVSALEAAGVRLWGEIQPGIPIGTLMEGIRPDLRIITKAGGFGNKEALLDAIHFLCRLS